MLLLLYYAIDCSGPMLALCLAREDAISEWRKALGPKEVEDAVQNDPESYVNTHAVIIQHLTLQS